MALPVLATLKIPLKILYLIIPSTSVSKNHFSHALVFVSYSVFSKGF